MNWRRVIEQLAGSNESPRRTAAALALGTFLSFSPFLGFQIATGMAIAFLLRLNRVAVFLGLNLNLPWLMIPWYTLTTFAGSALLKEPIAEDFGPRLSAVLELPFYRAVFWQHAYDFVAPFFWSFIVGSTLGAAVMGMATFFIAAPLLARFARDAQERAANRHIGDA